MRVEAGARRLDGAALAQELRGSLARTVLDLRQAYGQTPGLAVVLVGDDPASQVYVRNKVRLTSEAGMRSLEFRLPADVAEAEVLARLQALSADPEVDGILLQLPLPAHLDANRLLGAIDPDKDVDGLTPVSAGRLLLGQPGLRPCTPAGCVLLAKRAAPRLRGLRCVVLGRSILVGKPAALLFLAEDCTVTLAHSRTEALPALCREADILVAAVGRPEFVRGDWIKPGAIVLDVGINRINVEGKGRLVGDVAFAEAREAAAWITPVPGGVGPMTIACLLRNTVEAACRRRGWPLAALD